LQQVLNLEIERGEGCAEWVMCLLCREEEDGTYVLLKCTKTLGLGGEELLHKWPNMNEN
jgi:hypothetical protein